MLIIGCGDLGRRVARRAAARGEAVACLVGRDASAMDLGRAGLSARVANLDGAVTLTADEQGQRQLFYFAPPPATGTTDPRVAHFLDALDPGPRRLVYVSTTGVYGDCGGAWVDETRPPNPQVDRARRRHDAERRLQGWRGDGRELVILRVAGIYGPDKLPLERLRAGTPMIAEADAPWTNRIHVDDLVDVCEAAMARGRDGEVYNVSDGNPGNMRDYFDRVADNFGIDRAPSVSLAEAGGTLSPGLLSYLGESRRLDNRKMLADLGVRLAYPDLAAGLAACVAAMQADVDGS
jgi:nucleoside-diphosphate-sugar epimerase